MTSTDTPGANVLVCIPFSHYNERARWVLDLAHIPYIEKPYLPLFHMYGIISSLRLYGGRMNGQQDKVSSPLSTPLLIVRNRSLTTAFTMKDQTPSLSKNNSSTAFTMKNNSSTAFTMKDTTSSGRSTLVLSDSFDIMVYANQVKQLNLFPETYRDEILDVCKYLHDELGPVLRSWSYTYVLFSPTMYSRVAWYNPVSWLQRFGWYIGSILLIPTLCVLLKAFPWRRQGMVQKLRKIFHVMSERLDKQKLKHGYKYSISPGPSTKDNDQVFLCGNTLTFADITLAALGGIAVGIGSDTHGSIAEEKETKKLVRNDRHGTVEMEDVRGYGWGQKCYIPSLTDMPKEVQDLMHELRMTTAGQHIVRMYKEYRKV